jgi:hypothetical protein
MGDSPDCQRGNHPEMARMQAAPCSETGTAAARDFIDPLCRDGYNEYGI